MKTGNIRAIAWVILLVLGLVWGSSFILMKRGLEGFTFNEVGALRTSIAFLVLLPLAITRIRKVKKHHWIYLILSGITGSAAPAFLFAKAQTALDSGITGILNSLTPLFTLLIGVLIFHFKPKWYNIVGILIGFGGTAGLLTVSGGNSFEFNFSYAIYIIAATICYAMNINIIRYYLKDLDSLSITVFSFFLLGFPMLIYVFGFTDFVAHLSVGPEGVEAFMYIVILSVVATAGALIAFNQLIKLSNIIFASSVTYLIPVIALIWGVADGEMFKSSYLFWILLIIAGVFLVNFFPRNKPVDT